MKHRKGQACRELEKIWLAIKRLLQCSFRAPVFQSLLSNALLRACFPSTGATQNVGIPGLKKALLNSSTSHWTHYCDTLINFLVYSFWVLMKKTDFFWGLKCTSFSRQRNCFVFESTTLIKNDSVGWKGTGLWASLLQQDALHFGWWADAEIIELLWHFFTLMMEQAALACGSLVKGCMLSYWCPGCCVASYMWKAIAVLCACFINEWQLHCARSKVILYSVL